MSRIRFLLCFCLMVALTAGEPDTKTRRLFKDQSYQDLIRQFGWPKFLWTDDQMSEANSQLQHQANDAMAEGAGCKLLGITDSLERIRDLTTDETMLKAQVAWSESFYKEGVKISQGTVLEPLFKALAKDRQDKLVPQHRLSSAVLRSGGFQLIRTSVNWPAFREELLGPEREMILASEAFAGHGILPKGFDPKWLAGGHGRTELWDQAWAQAWEPPDPEKIAGLLLRMVYYRPNGLSQERTSWLNGKLEGAWGLPYRWADSSAPVLSGVLPEAFWIKVRAARLRFRSGQDAAALLAPVVSNPRDEYELSRLRATIGTEAALKSILDEEALLNPDPGIPGWTSESAGQWIESIRTRYQIVVATRLAEEKRVLEAKVRAERAKRLAEDARRDKKLKARLSAQFGPVLDQSVEILQEIARGYLQRDQAKVEIETRHLIEISATVRDSQPAAAVLRQRLLDEWGSGPGAVIGNDSSFSSKEKAGVNALIRKTVNGLHGQ